MLRMLLVVVAAILVVLVTLTIIKTLAWITGILIIVAGLGLLYGVFRLGRRSRRRSRDRI
jgi:cytochrome c biogenesis protein CcdA